MTVTKVLKTVGKPMLLLPVNDADKLKAFVEEWEKKLCDWVAEYRKIVEALDKATGDDKKRLEDEKKKKDVDFNWNWSSRIRQIREARAALRKLGVELPDPCDLKLEELK